MLDVRSEEFDKVLKENKLVLVDFYAVWCGPCTMQKQVLDKISTSRTEFEIVKVNIDESVDLARRFDIESIPTLVVFKDGKPVEKKIGFHEEESIIEMMQKHQD